MSRAEERRAALVAALLDGRLSAGRLARAGGCSIRTVYRDVGALRAAGLPIVGEPGVGYELTGELRGWPWTAQQASALLELRWRRDQNGLMPSGAMPELAHAALVRFEEDHPTLAQAARIRVAQRPRGAR